MQKDGYVYKSMLYYRRKYLAFMIASVLLFLWYTGAKLPYLRTDFMGAVPLDTERFISDTAMVITDEKVELGRKDHKLPDANCYRSNSYWQDGRYLFDIEADKVSDVVKTYSKMVNTGNSEEEMDFYKLYTAEVDGVNTAVLSYANQKVTGSLTGYLTEMQKPILAALTEEMKDGETLEVSEYVIDIRGLEMDTEGTDVALFWIWLVLNIIFGAKLVSYYIKPTLSATYRQLRRYGDIFTVENDINTQAENGIREEGEFILDDYIIEKSTFKIKVSRNHRAKN